MVIPSDNLCLKTYALVKKDYPDLPEISIYLHKTIPAGAGLGGGSSDAAFMLLLLNEKYKLKILTEKLYEYAQQLGSDCSFFLLNQAAFATGKGENLEPVDLSFTDLKMLIIHPNIHINTAEVFQEVTPSTIPFKSIKDVLRQLMSSWKAELKNDFEKIVFPKYPILRETKNKLYEFGAEYVSMTGTGSTIFAIFKGDHSEDSPMNSSWIIKWIY